MEQLVSMGFSSELAAEALAETGGKSTLKATEWILSRTTTSNPNPNPNPTPNPKPPSSNSNPTATAAFAAASASSSSQCQSQYQPKLDRFFHLQSKPKSSSSISPPSSQHHHHHVDIQEEKLELDHPRIRISIDPPSSPSPSPSPSPSCPIKDITNSNKRPKLLDSSAEVNENKNQQRPPPPPPPAEPLAERMRPRTLDDVVGQDHLLSPNSVLRSAIHCNRLPSIILWGPPGTGKTSIAKAIVNSFSPPHSSSLYRFVFLSAVTCGVKDVRDAVDDARKKTKAYNNNNISKRRTVLFLDEVHRFNKSQQDSFLPVIEDGTIVFMGATTENPSFHIITPLLSRCRVLTLNPLNPHHLQTILRRAITDCDRGLPNSLALPAGATVEVSEDAIQFISTNCDGDARVALNALEISATAAAARARDNGDGDDHDICVTLALTLDDANEALQCKHLAYDKAGEEHYNLISALHKSMRGSDADASIYWLARMLEGGEQPLYIARRLIRFASEDVGLADPLALNQAVACYQACHFLGMPECNVILAQCVAYLALAPKSISVYRAIEAAQKLVRESVGQNERVPLHLRNAPTKLMKELGYGKDYIYTPENPSSTQSYLPASLQGCKFLDWPSGNGADG